MKKMIFLLLVILASCSSPRNSDSAFIYNISTDRFDKEVPKNGQIVKSVNFESVYVDPYAFYTAKYTYTRLVFAKKTVQELGSNNIYYFTMIKGNFENKFQVGDTIEIFIKKDKGFLYSKDTTYQMVSFSQIKTETSKELDDLIYPIFHP